MKRLYTKTIQGKKEENENTQHIVLDVIKENEVPKVPKNQEQQQVPQIIASVRRYNSLRKPPKLFSPSLYYLLMSYSGEPECYQEAMQVETRKKWEQCMNEEMDSLVRNQTWYLVEFHVGKRAWQNKWVYMLKQEEVEKKRCKDRIIVKGFA